MAERKRKLDIADESAAKRPDMAASINPYTGKNYSQRYYDILEKRTGVGRKQQAVLQSPEQQLTGTAGRMLLLLPLRVACRRLPERQYSSTLACFCLHVLWGLCGALDTPVPAVMYCTLR
jgi:hypothetical protein